MNAARSVSTEGLVATIGGALANVFPLVGWLIAWMMTSGPAPDHGTGSETIANAAIVVITLSGIGGLAWLVGVGGALAGLVRQSKGSAGRVLVFAGLGLEGLAVIGWTIETVLALSGMDAHNGALRY